MQKITTQLLPAGSYTTIHSYLSEPRQPAPCPTGDIHITIDNNQKVSKCSGRIREGSTVPVHICCAVSYIKPGFTSNVMGNANLKPGNWLKPPYKDTMDKLNAEEEKLIDEFRKHRYSFIDEKLTKVQEEQGKAVDDSVYDFVDVSVLHEKQGFSVCSKCAFVFARNGDNDNCESCGHSSRYHDIDIDPYYQATNHHPGQPAKVTIGDPHMVNPSSMSNLKKVLEHIQSQMPDGTEWLIVWSDGVPYVYSALNQNQLYICKVC